MGIDVCGNHNHVAGRDLIILQQRCELAERLLGRQLDPTRSAPCAVCGWMCARSAAACPCCGADHKIERSRQQLQQIGRWVPTLTIAALLLAGAATFFFALELMRAQVGLPVSAFAMPAAPVVAVASLGGVVAAWLAHWRHVGC